jgi:hypothetical protein
VTEWFALGEWTGADAQRSLRASDRAAASAVGAGLLGAEPVSLLFQQGGEGTFGQAGGGGSGDLLHGVQIDVGSRPGLAEGMPGHDFAPAGGEVPDFLEFLGGEGAVRHGQSCLVLARIGGDAFLLPL